MTLIEFFDNYGYYFRDSTDGIKIKEHGSDFMIEILALGRLHRFSLQQIQNGYCPEFEILQSQLKYYKDYSKAFKNLLFTEKGVWVCDDQRKPLFPVKHKFNSRNPGINNTDWGTINKAAMAAVSIPGTFFCYHCSNTKVVAELSFKIKGAHFCTYCAANFSEPKGLSEKPEAEKVKKAA